jgi:protein-S-isoprenylcysteine O-methyltransferase Ste14
MDLNKKLRYYIFETNVSSYIYILFYLTTVLKVGIEYSKLTIMERLNPSGNFTHVQHFFYLSVIFLIFTMNGDLRRLGNLILTIFNVLFITLLVLIFLDI